MAIFVVMVLNNVNYNKGGQYVPSSRLVHNEMLAQYGWVDRGRLKFSRILRNIISGQDSTF